MFFTQKNICYIPDPLNHFGVMIHSRIEIVIISLAQFNGNIVIVNISQPQKNTIEGDSLQTTVEYILGDNFRIKVCYLKT